MLDSVTNAHPTSETPVVLGREADCRALSCAASGAVSQVLDRRRSRARSRLVTLRVRCDSPPPPLLFVRRVTDPQPLPSHRLSDADNHCATRGETHLSTPGAALGQAGAEPSRAQSSPDRAEPNGRRERESP